MATDVKVFAPVLWDNENSFQGGKNFTVSAASIVVGIVAKPLGVTIPGVTSIPTYVNTLQIKDPVYNNLYLTLTLVQWAALVGTTNTVPDEIAIPPIVWTGDVEVPAGNIISSPLLRNIQPITINKAGSTIYNYVYTNGNPNGTLNLTVDGGLGAAEQIQIIYKKISG